MTKLKLLFVPLAMLLTLSLSSCSTGKSGLNPASGKLHTINTRSAADVKEFFKYTSDRVPFVSAHRGGPGKGFPENCLETFENTLKYTHAILEIDPHYTKDGKIVLMHDGTLNRTSNGTGKVSDYTLEELRKLRLKDTEGNLTDYQIPTLDEALQWAKGKTILVIDMKDVPIEERVRKIIENKAEANAIVIAYSIEDIKKAHALSKDIVMEVMMGKKENLDLIQQAGVPFENVVGFVSHDLPVKSEIFEYIHSKGVMGMQGSHRNYDRQFMSSKLTADQLSQNYRAFVGSGVDIIEADLGIAAGTALQPLMKKSSKSKFFK